MVERQQSLGNSITLKSKVNLKVFKCTCVTHVCSRHQKNAATNYFDFMRSNPIQR